MGKCPHLDALDTAFLQLSFALKLWNYLESHIPEPESYPFNKEAFDCSLTVEDGLGRICLKDNEFNTFSDIRIAASNNISICFGSAAITLWEAISEKGGYSLGVGDPNNSIEDNLAGLSYMIRCCFAHGSAEPIWKVNDKYKTIYRVGNKIINLKTVDGKIFEYSDIQGAETLRFLRGEATSRRMI